MRRRLAYIVLLTVATTVLASAPASAHGTAGAEPSNYKTVVQSFDPPVKGLRFESVEAGNRVELTNSTATDAIVPGYDGEPYLGVGPDGAFANTRSPAYYLNRSLDASNEVPPEADAKAEPQWKKVNSGETVSWHDHRAHWMGKQDPPIVRSAPDAKHRVIDSWTIAIAHGPANVTARGYVDWIPAGSATPWWLLALALFGAGLALCIVPSLSEGNWGKWIAAATLALIAVDVVHTLGLTAAASGALQTQITKGINTALPSAIAWVVGIRGVVRMRGGFDDGPWFVMFAAGLIAFLGGVADLASLDHSQLPFAFPSWIARLSVAVSIGLGAGLATGLAVRLVKQRQETLVTPEDDVHN